MIIEEKISPRTFSGNPPRILIIEDDNQIAQILREYLECSLNAEVRWAADATEAMELDADKWAEIIIVDYMLPDIDGIRLAKLLTEDDIERPCIFITGFASVDCAIEAMRAGIKDMFVKPIDLEKLGLKIIEFLEQYRWRSTRIKRLNKMRSLVKGFIKERRELRRKMVFLCKDIVYGYKQLLYKLNKYGIDL